MKFKINVAYSIDQIIDGSAGHSKDFACVYGCTRIRSVNRKKVTPVNNQNFWGVYIGEKLDKEYDNFIIFDKDISEPRKVSETKIYSPIDWCWSYLIHTEKGIISEIVPIERKIKEEIISKVAIKKDAIKEDAVKDIVEVIPSKKSEITNLETLEPREGNFHSEEEKSKIEKIIKS